jgi:hypothetical protein
MPAPILGEKHFLSGGLEVNYSINPGNLAKKQPENAGWYNFRSVF